MDDAGELHFAEHGDSIAGRGEVKEANARLRGDDFGFGVVVRRPREARHLVRPRVVVVLFCDHGRGGAARGGRDGRGARSVSRWQCKRRLRAQRSAGHTTSRSTHNAAVQAARSRRREREREGGSGADQKTAVLTLQMTPISPSARPLFEHGPASMTRSPTVSRRPPEAPPPPLAGRETRLRPPRFNGSLHSSILRGAPPCASTNRRTLQCAKSQFASNVSTSFARSARSGTSPLRFVSPSW